MKSILLITLFTLLLTVTNAQNRIISQRTKGVLLYQYKLKLGDEVAIYSKNSSILRRLTVDDNLSRDAVINPFAMKGENFLLVFDCIGITAKEYIVIANDENGLLGYVKKSDPHFKFETWPQHIVYVVAVDFDVASNPMHILPDPKSLRIKGKPGEFFFRISER